MSMFYKRPGNPPEQAQSRARRKVTPSPSQREAALNTYLASLPAETQKALSMKYGLLMGRHERRAAYKGAEHG